MVTLQLQHEVEHLGLNRYIKSRYGFITHHQFWLGGQRASQHDALSLTTTELVGK